MPRGKTTIHPKANDVERTSRHESKRVSNGILDEVQEVSMLCNDPAYVVIDDIDDTAEPKVCPSMQETTNMMQSCLDLPESSVDNGVLDREAILHKKLAQAENKLKRMISENRQLDIIIIMNDIIAGLRKNMDDLDPVHIEELQCMIAMSRKGIRNRIKELRSEGTEASSLPLAQLVAQPMAQPVAQPASQVGSVKPEIIEDEDSPHASA
ncbi:hypothetical protein GUJ93_ZPchr0387g2491 [Zizania palustris]|uniref:Uncharacterized protein n=1 Tax=Zizania palustris TaxID=103762 RepID=A0A8J5RGP3_ZIZPA|nr:hypothetical protein GUJ93_ZPchr0387g2491 [Zizania palustris]